MRQDVTKIYEILQKYHVDVIAIGNVTASHESKK